MSGLDEEMIERVAREIGPEFYGTPWDQISEFRRGICRDLAVAAIKGMREPTQRMLRASSRGDQRRAAGYWRRMIDAAVGK